MSEINNKDTFEFPFTFPEELKARLVKEMELTEDIKFKLHEVCSYMWEHELSAITLGYASGVKFTLKMNREEAADGEKEQPRRDDNNGTA